MIKIVRVSDVLPVEIDGVTFFVAPISSEKKAELLQSIEEKGGLTKLNTVSYMKTLLKWSLKRIDGLSDLYDNPYELRFDPDGGVSDECLEELMQLTQTGDAMATMANFAMNLKIDPDRDSVKVQNVSPLEKLPQKKTE